MGALLQDFVLHVLLQPTQHVPDIGGGPKLRKCVSVCVRQGLALKNYAHHLKRVSASFILKFLTHVTANREKTQP